MTNYSDRFLRAMYEDPGIFAHEGGLVDHRHDPGGVTNYGISLRFLRQQGPIFGDLDGDGDVDADDIRAMDEDDALEIYWKLIWNERQIDGKSVYDLMPYAQSAARVFDHHVNAGPKSAGMVVQRACRPFGHHLKEDGFIGPNTLKTIHECSSALLWPLKSERAGFYRYLTARNGDFRSFINGWLRRAYH